jgi:hypothetical protein
MSLLDKIEGDISGVWHHWSSKILAALMVFPEAYNGLSSLGWFQSMPTAVAHAMSGLATMGFLAKFYRQQPKGKLDGTDSAKAS